MQAAQAPRLRRVRRTIRHVDVGSVFKVSLVMYLSVLVVLMICGVILWIVASVMGAISSLEHFIDTIFGQKSFTLPSAEVLFVGLLVGLVLVILGTLFNVLCAVLYNLTCDIAGGIRIIEVEEVPGAAPQR